MPYCVTSLPARMQCFLCKKKKRKHFILTETQVDLSTVMQFGRLWTPVLCSIKVDSVVKGTGLYVTFSGVKKRKK